MIRYLLAFIAFTLPVMAQWTNPPSATTNPGSPGPSPNNGDLSSLNALINTKVPKPASWGTNYVLISTNGGISTVAVPFTQAENDLRITTVEGYTNRAALALPAVTFSAATGSIWSSITTIQTYTNRAALALPASDFIAASNNINTRINAVESYTNRAALALPIATFATYSNVFDARISSLQSGTVTTGTVVVLQTNIYARLDSNFWSSADSTTNYQTRTGFISTSNAINSRLVSVEGYTNTAALALPATVFSASTGSIWSAINASSNTYSTTGALAAVKVTADAALSASTASNTYATTGAVASIAAAITTNSVFLAPAGPQTIVAPLTIYTQLVVRTDELSPTLVSNGTFTSNSRGWGLSGGIIYSSSRLILNEGLEGSIFHSNGLPVSRGAYARLSYSLSGSATASVSVAAGNYSNTFNYTGSSTTNTFTFYVTGGTNLTVSFTNTSGQLLFDNVTLQRYTNGSVSANDLYVSGKIYGDVIQFSDLLYKNISGPSASIGNDSVNNIDATATGSFFAARVSAGTNRINAGAYGSSMQGYYQGGTRIIGADASAALMRGYFSGHNAYIYGSGASQVGYFNNGTSLIGTNSIGSLQLGTFAPGIHTILPFAGRQLGYFAGIAFIGSTAHGAAQLGYLHQDSVATNLAPGAIQIMGGQSGERYQTDSGAMGSILVGPGTNSIAYSVRAAGGFYGDAVGLTNFPASVVTTSVLATATNGLNTRIVAVESFTNRAALSLQSNSWATADSTTNYADRIAFNLFTSTYASALSSSVWASADSTTNYASQVSFSSFTSSYATADATTNYASRITFNATSNALNSSITSLQARVVYTTNLSAIAGSGLGVTSNQLVVTNVASYQSSYTGIVSISGINASTTPSNLSIRAGSRNPGGPSGNLYLDGGTDGAGGWGYVAITSSTVMATTIQGVGLGIDGTTNGKDLTISGGGGSTPHNGGNLILRGGTGSASGTNGHIILQSRINMSGNAITNISLLQGNASGLTNFPSSLLTLSAAQSNYWQITTAPASNSSFGQRGHLAVSSSNVFIYSPDALGTGTGRWIRISGDIAW